VKEELVWLVLLVLLVLSVLSVSAECVAVVQQKNSVRYHDWFLVLEILTHFSTEYFSAFIQTIVLGPTTTLLLLQHIIILANIGRFCTILHLIVALELAL
jgi:hypothetical protein